MIYLVGVIVFAAIAIGVSQYLKYRLAHMPDQYNLEAILDKEINKLAHHSNVQGLVLGVYKDGRTWFRGCGRVSRDDNDAPSSYHTYQLASISKLFTAALLQILCDEGVLTMAMTLADTLGDKIDLSPAVKNVTLRQLATHTSGFPREPRKLLAEVQRRAGKITPQTNPFSYISTEELLASLTTCDKPIIPGRFEYSNFGMGLLGHIFEMQTGKSLDTLATEKLFRPLAMHDTAIAPTERMQQNFAPGHTAKGEPTAVWTFTSLAGAGAFNSNAEDMIIFVRAILHGQSKLCDSLRKMFNAELNGEFLLGWMRPTGIDRFLGNRSIIWHNGRVGGYCSYLAIDPDRQLGVVILSNRASDVTFPGMLLMRLIRMQSWAAPKGKHDFV